MSDGAKEMITQAVREALSGSSHFTITIAPNEDGHVLLTMSHWRFDGGQYVETPYFEEQSRNSLHEALYIAGHLMAKRMDDRDQIPPDLRQRPGPDVDNTNERHWHRLFQAEIRGYGRE